MQEEALLHHITRATPAHPYVTVGPGDDCAVIARPDGPVIVTTDQVIEGRHFTTGEDLALVARKAVCRSLSDIAAMAGSPRWAVATGALPAAMSQHDAQRLTDAIHATAGEFGCPVVGGDIAATTGPMVLTVTIAGAPHPTRGPVLRSTALAGDTLYVTGALGGSLPSRRHLTFTPRLIEAYWLATLLGPALHAMMDISDGLGLDATRMARASHAAATLDASLFPRHPSVATWQAAAGDGEDYELLFAVAPDASVPSRCPLTGTPITAVGRIAPPSVSGALCTVIDPSGTRHDGAAFGWEHRS